MKLVIMAGGGGKRLWPISQKNKPKQINSFLGKETLLKMTFRRLLVGFRREDIIVATHIDQKRMVKKDLSELRRENLFLEPTRKNTALAIGLAALRIAKKNPQEIMANINSDAYIKNLKEYLRVLKVAQRIVKLKPDHLVMIGVKPNYPETGYGYIKIGQEIMKLGPDKIFKIDKFIEKPDFRTTQKYLKQGNYLWNPTLLVFQVDLMLNLFRKFLPEHYKILKASEKFLGTKSEMEILTQKIYPLKSISIDFGILERTKEMLVIPADFGWNDIGHWRAIYDILSGQKTYLKEGLSYVVSGDYLPLESKRNLVYSLSGKLVATIGINDMIIIEGNEVILICPRERAQEVKKIVHKIEEKKLNKYL